MSQTPTARPSPAGSPAPRPPINLEGIYMNIPVLIARVRNNLLVANQIPPLRNLIANHAKEIIIFHARLGRGNPIINLPDVLNPTKKVGNSEAITTEQAFLASVQAGIAAARNTKPDPVLIANMQAKTAAARASPAAQAAANAAKANQAAAGTASTPGSAPGTPSPAPVGQPGQAQTPQQTAAAAQAAAAARAAAPQQPPPQQPPMSIAQVKELMALPTEQRNAKLEADAALRQRFVASCQFYQRRTQQVRTQQQPPPAAANVNAPKPQPPPPSQPVSTPTPPTGTASPRNPDSSPSAGRSASTGPARTTAASAAPAAAAAAASPATASQTPTTPAVVVPPRPVSPPRAPPPPPPPPEPEPVRRKRKLREYAREQAPGLDLELGIDDIFSEVLDKLVDTVARDSVRLAAHRSSPRVELKDMAFVLEHYHDIVVPGFSAHVPKKVHNESEADRKRGRAVMRRAAGKRDDE